MKNIFYTFFVFTRSHKAIAAVVFSTFLLACLFFASQIELKENIMDVIPKDRQISRVRAEMEGFTLKNRLVMHVYASDSAALPGELIAAAHRFSDSLQETSAAYISGIRLEISDSNVMALYDYYHRYLPFYLESEDYEEIAQRITDHGVKEALDRNFKALASPMGMVTKTMMVKDPLGLVNFPLQKANDLRVDDNITLYQNHLMTKDKKHLIFFITLSYPPSETAQNGAFLAAMDARIKAMEQENPSVHIEYFGPAAVSAANASRIKEDIYLTVSFAIIGLFLFISLFYRNPSVFFMAITPGLFGAVVAVALLALVRGSVSVIALGVGSVLLGITIDYALHFITHFRHRKDPELLFSDISNPLLMSSLTTACAFFSLLFIRSEALTDLGWFAGTSVLVASLFTLLVLPHMVISTKKDRGTDKRKKARRRNTVELWVAKMASYPFDKRKWPMAAFLIITAVSLFTWKNYAFESNMLALNYMPERLAKFERNLNAVSSYSAGHVYLITRGDNLWEALESETAAKEKLASLKEEGRIHGFVMVSGMIPPRSLQAERRQRWEAFWHKKNTGGLFPRFYKAARQAGFQPEAFSRFESMVTRPYPLLDSEAAGELFKIFGEDLIIPHKDGTVSVVASVQLSPENKKTVLEELETLEGSVIFDKGYFVDKLVSLLKDNFNKLVNISSLVVFALLLIHYGRLELAIIAFLPVLLSWLWILGVMGLFALKFNIVNIIVCTFIFGLGIDYSIFMMRGLGQDYKFGLNNLTSYKKSIILSAVTTLTGIGVLIFAGHPALRSIALLGIIGILSVIFLSFTIQPALYHLFIGRRKKKGLIPYTLVSLLLTAVAFCYFLLGCFLLAIVRLIFMVPLTGQEKKRQAFHWLIMTFCRSLLALMANIRKEYTGMENLDLTRPAMIIANHHSFLDIILLLSLSSRVVMVTNDWVYHSPFFGKVVQYAGFVPASEGIEKQAEKIRGLIDKGYSIMVFPEGGRSENARLGRFHKGAFYLAGVFQLDLQPVIFHGTSYVMPKNDGFHVKSGAVVVKVLPKIPWDEERFGATYRERAKVISRYFKEEYQKIREEREIPEYFKEVILKNYIYKGPVTEWYLRVKFALEQGYREFHRLVPADAVVTDIGCGYGMISLGLALSGEGRKVTGIDYDAGKIAVAANCPSGLPNLHFVHADATCYAYQPSDVFIISDVLHYLTPEAQQDLLHTLARMLRPGGKIIIRDGDASQRQRHRVTMLTEMFSTKSGFNKMKQPLNYISADAFREFAAKNNFTMDVVDQMKLTSNMIFVLQPETEKMKHEHGKV